MRLIFAGTPQSAATTLEALVTGGFNVVGVLTREDVELGRSRVLTATPVAAVASRYGLEYRKTNVISAAVQSWIADKEADLGVIVAYGSILRKAVLDQPAKGWVNLHYSLLPDFPGAAPVQQAIREGRTVTGVTIFRLDEGVDTGPILSSEDVRIAEDVTSGELLDQLSKVGSELLIRTLLNLDEYFSKQQQQSTSNSARGSSKISRADARINFLEAATDVHNLVRAMNPEPVAWFEVNQMAVRVLKTEVSKLPGLGVGECRVETDELFVGCGSGAVKLLKVQPAGKTPMSGADWFRGLRSDSLGIT